MSKAKNVLIVDDDVDDRELFIEAVAEIDSSITCYSAEDCEIALEKLADEKEILPDVIFLDLNMPRLNGKQCLDQLKKSARLQHIPVVIYSTSSLQKDIEETRQLGAKHFITKPSNFKELCNALASVLL